MSTSRSVVLSVLGLVLLPVTVVLLVGAATGVLTGGIITVTRGDVVSGYDLDALRRTEAATLVPPADTPRARYDVEGSSLVFGPDRAPIAGQRILTDGTYQTVQRFYDRALEDLGYEQIPTPTPMIPQAGERWAYVWRADNMYARLVLRTDPRELVELGGVRGQLLYQFTVSPLGDEVQ